MGNVPHDIVTHHAGEREDGEVAKELFWRDVRQPAKQDNDQRHDGVFAPRRRRFRWFCRLRRRFRRSLRLSGNLYRRCRPGDFPFTHHGHAAHHHIIKINGDVAVFLFAEQLQQINEVRAVQLRGLGWQTSWQVGITDHLHAVRGRRDLIWHGILTVTAVLRRQIDNHAARLHGIHHLTGDQLRRRFTWNKRGGDNDVHLFCLRRKERHFRLNKGFRHDLRVTITAARFFLEVQLKEFGAHTLHLLLHFRPGIKRTNNSAQAVCGPNSGKTCHTGTNYHHLRGWYFACGRNLTGKEATKLMRSFDNGAIAGNVCHRTQRIQRLRARNTRHGIHRHHGDTACRQLLHQLRVLGWPDKAHKRRARVQQFNFTLFRCVYLQNNG